MSGEWERINANPEISKNALWFGLLGGGIAWLAHFLSSYVIAEFGCVSRWGQGRFLGVTGQAWLLLGVSISSMAVATGALIVARRAMKRLGAHGGGDAQRGPAQMAKAGVVTSGVFLFVIIVESIPIFFFLQSC